ncbi:MAG: D-tyrosyl-tRNA(Tyr) deacylase [Acidobacteria bacterium]|nr:D-tyrosyl-tRNA(Tyr) deacylase [Acidobacteriota bacterium]
MKAVVQRVKRASVTVEGEAVGAIGKGLLVLLGVAEADTAGEADKLAEKILNIRLMDDEQGRMNLSVMDVTAEILVVSQFTLLADVRKGRRPSYIGAAAPEKANELYEYFVDRVRASLSRVETGRFRAMMDVELVNDGPVTIILDTNEF